ncbi:MAG: DUF971 domain-containing protein [Sutterella sp.]|nr:DUF971 domain-containing protein [Sutterella sp.]
MKIPSNIVLHKKSRELELSYEDGVVARLPFEFLRVYSPSAEVKGHAPGQEVLQVGKKNVDVTGLEPMGNYALKIVYSDGHDSGLYSWDYLEDLITHYDELWADYLDRLEKAGASREPSAQEKVTPKPSHGCGGGSCGCHS